MEYRSPPANWFELGCDLNLEEPGDNDEKTFYFSKRLEDNRFVDVHSGKDFVENECTSCR